MNKQLTVEEKLNLLLKPNWNYKDIADYFGCGVTKASEIKKKARMLNGGKPKYMKDQVTIDAVFEIQGIDLKSELLRVKAIKEIYDTDLTIGVA